MLAWPGARKSGSNESLILAANITLCTSILTSFSWCYCAKIMIYSPLSFQEVLIETAQTFASLRSSVWGTGRLCFPAALNVNGRPRTFCECFCAVNIYWGFTSQQLFYFNLVFHLELQFDILPWIIRITKLSCIWWAERDRHTAASGRQ